MKSDESRCPHCGATLRDGTGRLLRTATAAVLGLVAVTASCDDTIVEPQPEYGPGATTTAGPGGQGGAGGSDSGGMGGEPVAEYGPGPTVGGGGTDVGGAGGAGGT